jgi:curved DNA-binding protein CbpA
MAAAIPRDPYETLGIRRDASSAEIARAYRLRARELHPDARPTGPDAGDQFRIAAAAYELLSDPARRAAYDLRARPARSAQGEPASQGPRPPGPTDGSILTSHAAPAVRPGPVRIEPLPGQSASPHDDAADLLADALELIRQQARGRRYRPW